MPGEEHGNDLVSDLSLVHGLAILKASQEQQREEIAAVLATQPPLPNDPGNELIDPPERAAVTYVAGNRDTVRDKERPTQTGRDLGHQYIGRLLDLGNIPLDAGPKEGLCSNLQSQRHDLGVNIDPLARRPAFE